MKKADAIALLGGTVSAAADACQISRSAVSQWPEVLTKDQIDRVQAALFRQIYGQNAAALAAAAAAAISTPEVRAEG